MPEWKLHWLEAEGDLELWRPQIAAEIEPLGLACRG